MVQVLPDTKDFPTNTLHYQHVAHKLWTSSMHIQCPSIDGGLLS